MSDPILVDLYAEALSEARNAARALGDLSFLSADQLAATGEVQNALAPEALFQEPSLDRIEELRAALAVAQEDPRIAAVGDLCAVLEGPDLLREDTVCAIEGLARLVADKLERAVRRDRPDPLREPLETLYGALLATVETARSLEAVLVADDAIGAGKAGM